MEMFKISFYPKKDIPRLVVTCIAALIMAANIKTFVNTGGLFPGGATGLTILIQNVGEKMFGISIPYTPVNLLINAVPIYIGFKYIGKKFTLFSCLMIFLSGLFVDMIPSQAITYDPLLISIFGGLISGFAVSLCLNVGTTSGGTDFIAIYLSKKKGIDSFNAILIFNAVLLIIAGFLFGFTRALYSIIFQYVSTQVVHTMYRKYQQEALFIVTDRPKDVCLKIYDVSRHGATILKGKGSYENQERKVVYSVVSANETKKVINAITAIDENAFIDSIKTQHNSGHFYYEEED